ncbi:hypothetical protein FPZ42_13375 [Mucilaginibacter achroorhodeus]|uniref:Uncharacterized protein n=1 Tax=Mucilaginibacter achroorhodeus TaxID=2599294 RepID=A0A563U2M2_9SPHI|nr:hypothetical protein [Mucilaginibacter achroorhodeus]TWR25579.1 hypothetical protein FPZ42_13375 [Mucilaginibacter achroorhodeus]
MDENRLNILNASTRIISKLHLLSVFFNNDIIYKIYLRTQVLHQLFQTNPELDINQLDMFHLQFTQSLIDLLKTIKKGNEANADLLLDEVALNNQLIEQMEDSAYTEHTFVNDKQRQALKMSQSLRKLFQVLSDNLSDYPFTGNINKFSLHYSADYFFNVSTDLVYDLLAYTSAEVYSNEYATIGRKLMGTLCKYDFKIEFYCGLRANDLVLEVYKFADVNKHFIFSPLNNVLLFCDVSKLGNLDLKNTVCKRERMMRELRDKNIQLTGKAGLIKTNLPDNIAALLADNYKKIADVNFLEHINAFDVQANILKTMLNTDII